MTRYKVSMESGLEDRNNIDIGDNLPRTDVVSMESGLEDRNIAKEQPFFFLCPFVSMESGLEDRNNSPPLHEGSALWSGLNGVRPRRPEQSLARGRDRPHGSRSQWSPA